MEKLEPLCTVSENVKWFSRCGKQYGIPQKLRSKTIIWSSNSTSGYVAKIIESRVSRDIFIPMFIEALFKIGKMWKQPKCPWISKMWWIHAIEYYSPLKRKEILTHATTWMNLEDIMVNEISQSQKDKYFMIPLRWDT